MMTKQCSYWQRLIKINQLILLCLILFGGYSATASELKVSDSIGIAQGKLKAQIRKAFLVQDKSVTVADKILIQGTEHTRKELLSQSRQQKPATQETSAKHHEYRIYDAHTHLIGDEDHDGYYQKFSITFDADSQSSHWETVYAKLYLSSDGGNTWIHYFTTKDFIIEGNESYDDYEVATTLYNGYPAHEYDVLIDLYEEGDDNHIVATYSSFDNSELFALPLESKNYDARATSPSSKCHGSGGGSFDFILLGSIALITMRRRCHMKRYNAND
jgi:hypothetical protein